MWMNAIMPGLFLTDISRSTVELPYGSPALRGWRDATGAQMSDLASRPAAMVFADLITDLPSGQDPRTGASV